jgi:predicted  nucleic acid-binding Zn-ribbon protein
MYDMCMKTGSIYKNEDDSMIFKGCKFIWNNYSQNNTQVIT